VIEADSIPLLFDIGRRVSAEPKFCGSERLGSAQGLGILFCYVRVVKESHALIALLRKPLASKSLTSHTISLDRAVGPLQSRDQTVGKISDNK
jgi:hypothetical protein